MKQLASARMGLVLLLGLLPLLAVAGPGRAPRRRPLRPARGEDHDAGATFADAGGDAAGCTPRERGAGRPIPAFGVGSLAFPSDARCLAQMGGPSSGFWVPDDRTIADFEGQLAHGLERMGVHLQRPLASYHRQYVGERDLWHPRGHAPNRALIVELTCAPRARIDPRPCLDRRGLTPGCLLIRYYPQWQSISNISGDINCEGPTRDD